jgi:rubrerythrin
MASPVNPAQLRELLHQALETEMGGIAVYESAIECAQNRALKEAWQEYLEETRTHRQVLLELFEKLALDPDTQTPGREVVAHHAASLVEAMTMARNAGDPAAAELVATECVVLAETKDHANWELIGLLGEKLRGKEARALKEAHEQVHTDEEHHLHHTRGWSRELWLQALGMPAVLPPPEEVKNVETAIGAARASQARDRMLHS